MVRITTFVFINVETTGLSKESRITELSMAAVRREHMKQNILGTSEQPELIPRVVNKLTLCLNPGKPVEIGAAVVSGLHDELLEHQMPFSKVVVRQLNSFLNMFEKPICLVAHNGMRFDFPILKKHLEEISASFPDDLLCADSLYAVYDITEGDKRNQKSQVYIKEKESKVHGKEMLKQHLPGKVRSIFYEGNSRPEKSYKRRDVYARVVGDASQKSKGAEGDSLMLLEITVKMGSKIIRWFDKNCLLFHNVESQATRGYSNKKVKLV